MASDDDDRNSCWDNLRRAHEDSIHHHPTNHVSIIIHHQDANSRSHNSDEEWTFFSGMQSQTKKLESSVCPTVQIIKVDKANCALYHGYVSRHRLLYRREYNPAPY